MGEFYNLTYEKGDRNMKRLARRFRQISCDREKGRGMQIGRYDYAYAK